MLKSIVIKLNIIQYSFESNFSIINFFFVFIWINLKHIIEKLESFIHCRFVQRNQDSIELLKSLSEINHIEASKL